LNTKVGTGLENDVMGIFGVPGENDNGRRMKDMCKEKHLCMTN